MEGRRVSRRKPRRNPLYVLFMGLLALSLVRVDDDLRAKAAAVYEELGIDLPTAIRMFLKRSVVVNGVPFSMTLPKQEYRAERAIRAVQSLSEAAQQNGTADMSLDEINAEIAASRADRASRNARNGA